MPPAAIPMTAADRHVLIAVVGGSGAGKGWLVERLCRLLGRRACHLQLDDFYLDRSHLPMSERRRINFDEPRAIDWEAAERVLRDCRAGRGTSVPRYDFATHTRAPGHVPWELRPVVFVDGLWLLHPPAVRRLFDLSVYLDTPMALRHRRRLARDVAERGYTAGAIEHQLRTAVAPMHERYVEPQKPHADVVLTQPFREDELAGLADRLWEILSRAELIEPWLQTSFRAELVALLSNHEYHH